MPLDTALLKLGKGRAIFRSLKLRLRRNVKKLAIPFPRELLRPHCVDGQFSGSVKVWDKSTPLLLLSDFDHRSIVVSVYDDAGEFLFIFDYDQLPPAGLGHWLVFIEWLATVSEGVDASSQASMPARPLFNPVGPSMASKLFRGRCPFAQPQVEEGDRHRQPPPSSRALATALKQRRLLRLRQGSVQSQSPQ